MILIADLHQQGLNNPEYKTAYEAQRTEYKSGVVIAHYQILLILV
jgi:hypothetical protein